MFYILLLIFIGIYYIIIHAGVSDADDTAAIVVSLLVIGLLITCGVIVAIVVLRNIHVHKSTKLLLNSKLL